MFSPWIGIGVNLDPAANSKQTNNATERDVLGASGFRQLPAPCDGS